MLQWPTNNYCNDHNNDSNISNYNDDDFYDNINGSIDNDISNKDNVDNTCKKAMRSINDNTNIFWYTAR